MLIIPGSREFSVECLRTNRQVIRAYPRNPLGPDNERDQGCVTLWDRRAILGECDLDGTLLAYGEFEFRAVSGRWAAVPRFGTNELESNALLRDWHVHDGVGWRSLWSGQAESAFQAIGLAVQTCAFREFAW